jgi:hypothetical protein
LIEKGKGGAVRPQMIGDGGQLMRWYASFLVADSSVSHLFSRVVQYLQRRRWKADNKAMEGEDCQDGYQRKAGK